MTGLRRILIISLGNPGQYRNTYHSAGHLVLEGLQKLLPREQPVFTLQNIGRERTLASVGERWSLLQSPTLMNISGPWVARAYREHLIERGLSPNQLGLVLVHDDLEEALGDVKVRAWKASHRGHNGVKSVFGALCLDSTAKSARVSIGIGRPETKDRALVSDYVLSEMPKFAKMTLSQRASKDLYVALLELEDKWK